MNTQHYPAKMDSNRVSEMVATMGDESAILPGFASSWHAHAAAAASGAFLLLSPAMAHPVPLPELGQVTSIRFTDIDGGYNCITKRFDYRLEFEVLKWTDQEAFQLSLAENFVSGLNTTSPRVWLISVDADGRPLPVRGAIRNDDANFPPADGTSGVKSGATNRWRVVSQDVTGIRWGAPSATPGNGIPPRDLVGAGGLAKACALVPGCTLDPSGSPVLSNPETIDNGAPSTDGLPDNVLDGFVLRIDGVDPGEVVSFNWFLLDASGKPIGTAASGNPYGFGTLTIVRAAETI